jgi:hypothetical protein
VVNDTTSLPLVNTEPPVEAAYQSIVDDEAAVADIVTDPVLHTDPPNAPLGADGNASTVVVMILEVAGVPVAHVAFDVNTTVTMSLLFNESVV